MKNIIIRFIKGIFQVEPKEHISICLNNQTAGNLINYLKSFPEDARVSLYTYDNMTGKYVERDIRICSNFENQKEKNTVLLMPGYPVEIKSPFYKNGDQQ